MGIRSYRPYTPGNRSATVSDFSEITKTKPEKSLTKFKHSPKGRNNRGVITSRRRGGGHKRLYRQIDFRRDKYNIPAKVAAIEYDPNRNARIALLFYQDGEKRYIIAPAGLTVGTTIISGPDAAIETGNALPLSKIPLGEISSQHRTNPRKRGTNCPCRRCSSQINGKRRGLCYHRTSFQRSTNGEKRMLCHHWSSR